MSAEARKVALTVRLTGVDYVLRHHSANGVVAAAVVPRTKEIMVAKGLATWVAFPRDLRLTLFGEEVKRELFQLYMKPCTDSER